MSNWEWIQIKNHNVCTQVLAVSELCHMAIHMLTCATRYNINKTPAGKAAAAGHSYWEGKCRFIHFLLLLSLRFFVLHIPVKFSFAI